MLITFIQTNVLGYLKNNMKDQHDFMDSKVNLEL